MQEIALTGGRDYANPFNDVTIDATFRCGSQTVNVSGFYDGNAVWKVRLMPTRIGSCTFKTRSNDRAVNDVSGRFRVIEHTREASCGYGWLVLPMQLAQQGVHRFPSAI